MSKNSKKNRYLEIKKVDFGNKITLFGSIDEDYIKNSLKRGCDRHFGTFDICINETNSSFRILDMSLNERADLHNDKYILDYYSRDDVLKNKTLDEISHKIYNEVQRDRARSAEIVELMDAKDVSYGKITELARKAPTKLGNCQYGFSLDVFSNVPDDTPDLFKLPKGARSHSRDVNSFDTGFVVDGFADPESAYKAVIDYVNELVEEKGYGWRNPPAGSNGVVDVFAPNYDVDIQIPLFRLSLIQSQREIPKTIEEVEDVNTQQMSNEFYR